MILHPRQFLTLIAILILSPVFGLLSLLVNEPVLAGGFVFSFLVARDTAKRL